jgi:hypothetical protein
MALSRPAFAVLCRSQAGTVMLLEALPSKKHLGGACSLEFGPADPQKKQGLLALYLTNRNRAIRRALGLTSQPALLYSAPQRMCAMRLRPGSATRIAGVSINLLRSARRDR